MSYNGSGTFNINTAGQPVVTGTVITSTAFNALTADLAGGLTTALTKDGQTTPTANIPMGTFKITGLGAGTALTDAAQFGQLQAGATQIATVTGTDTLAGTLTPTPTAYATGNLFSFVAVNTNTGAATINLNSLGAKNITKLGSTALAAGDIVSGRIYLIEYDGTRFQLINPSASSVASFSAGTTGFTPSTATTGAVTLAGTLITSNGGTGLSSYTAGDLPYYATGTALSKLGIGTNGQILTSSGTAPQWSTLSGVAVTTFSAGTTGFTPSTATSGAVTLAGTLATTNGGTGLTSFTANGVVYASSSSALATGSALTFDGTNFATTGNIDSGTGKNIALNATSSGDTTRLQWKYQGTAYAWIERVNSNGDMAFGVQSSEQMRLTSTGLGIGTSSPAYKLDVNGVINGNNSIISRRASGSQPEFVLTQTSVASWSIYNPPSSTDLRFYNGSDLLTLTSSGNLGLGVTPSAWYTNTKVLQLNYGAFGTQAVTGSATMFNNAYESANGVYNYITTNGAGRYTQTLGSHYWFNAPSGTAGNAITFTQAMTLDASGNLLVGKTSSDASAKGCELRSGFATLTSDADVALYLRRNTSNGDIVQFRSAAALVGSISVTGSVTSYNVTSDQRLKENITDADSVSSLIDALQVRKFDWKTDRTHQRYGFIAQELVTVAPEAVYQPTDTEEMMAVDYSKLVPMLVKEIQSLRKRLATAGI